MPNVMDDIKDLMPYITAITISATLIISITHCTIQDGKDGVERKRISAESGINPMDTACSEVSSQNGTGLLLCQSYFAHKGKSE